MWVDYLGIAGHMPATVISAAGTTGWMSEDGATWTDLGQLPRGGVSPGCQAKDLGSEFSSAVGYLCNLRKVTSFSILNFKTG